MVKIRYQITALILLFCMTSWSQDKNDIKEAHKLFKNEQYAEAMPMYKRFLTIDPTNKEYAYKYGGCLVMLNQNNSEALKYLLALEKEGVSDKKITFFIGRAYENEENYEKAKIYYERFKKVADKEQIRRLKIRKRIRTCKKALR